MQAIASPWSEWISELQARYFTPQDGLTQQINVSVKRGQNFQLIAGLAYCCDKYKEKGQPTSRNLERWLLQTSTPPPSLKKAMSEALGAFWFIASSDTLNHGFTQVAQRVSPTEFIFTGAPHLPFTALLCGG